MKIIKKVTLIVILIGMIIFIELVGSKCNVVYATEVTNKTTNEEDIFYKYESKLEESELLKDENVKEQLNSLYEYINLSLIHI